MTILKNIPLTLYIHLPWCVRKCPYCDFNSHEKKFFPEKTYVLALLENLRQYLPQINHRKISSIFFGGGTPSLFKAESIGYLLQEIKNLLAFENNTEISLEANPGTLDEQNFLGFFEAGVNRLSIGVQSFNDEKLKLLGRIHYHQEAISAIEIAKKVGFNNINIDLMYGLPTQTIEEGLSDLSAGLSFEPNHLSWYQLTIEPNSYFYRYPPELPNEEICSLMEKEGKQLLKTKGFQQYEVSAFAKQQRYSVHNLNYWQYGDYLGIGAGAHSKITDFETQKVYRFAQVKIPEVFMLAKSKITGIAISPKELIFEFMLNNLRLVDGFSSDLFSERTGLNINDIQLILNDAISQNLLGMKNNQYYPTSLGLQYLNHLTQLFLP